MNENKDISLAKTAKIAGNEWYHLAPYQRAEYKRKYDFEWETHVGKIKQYRDNDGFTKWKEIKEALPKKIFPKSQFSIYMRQNYEKQKTVSDPLNNTKSPPAKKIMRVT